MKMRKVNLSELKKYTEIVRVETEKVSHLIDLYDENKRGLSGVTGSYHIDHIMPIREGFSKNISPYQIADISNLQFISWEENNKRRKFIENLEIINDIKSKSNSESSDKKIIQLNGTEYDYYIHNNGIVENSKTGKIICQSIKINGYSHVILHKDCKNKYMTAHRLVAMHFIPNTENKPEVNHIDGNKQNNHYLNLEWVTSSENKKHCYVKGLASHRGIKNKQVKLSENDVLEIRKLFSQSSFSRIELVKMFKISKSHVDRILRKESWSHI